MKSSEEKLTIKQRKWLKLYIETGNATEAAFQAYDCKDRDSARALGSENLAKLNISELMENMGLTDVALINIGTEGMTKAVKQSMTGEVHPDYAVRHKYWDTMLKLKQKLVERKDITSNGEKLEQLVVIKANGDTSKPMADSGN